jgi:hypothetical protein
MTSVMRGAFLRALSPSVLLAIAVCSAAGCDSRLAVEGSGAGAGGGPTTILDAGMDGPAADPWVAKLAGYWMQQSIGDCINSEEWYTFNPPAGFVHTLVDRNFCGPHGVRVDPGSTSALSQIVSLAWTTPAGYEQRTFSTAVLDPYPSPPAPPVPGYVPGTRALNVMAYRRDGGLLVWQRETTSKSDWSTPPAGTSASSLRITVILDAPPGPSSGPVACKLTVQIDASSTLPGAQTSSGSETFVFPCHYAPKPGSPWSRLTADGFEQSDVDSTWYDFLMSKGVEGKYTPGVASLFEEGFRPILYFNPSEASELFHDVPFAWFFEMKSPPPAQAN